MTLKKFLNSIGVRSLGTEYWPIIEDNLIKFMADTGDKRVEERQAKDFEKWLKSNKIGYVRLGYRLFEIKAKSMKKWNKIISEIGP